MDYDRMKLSLCPYAYTLVSSGLFSQEAAGGVASPQWGHKQKGEAVPAPQSNWAIGEQSNGRF